MQVFRVPVKRLTSEFCPIQVLFKPLVISWHEKVPTAVFEFPVQTFSALDPIAVHPEDPVVKALNKTRLLLL